MHIIDELKRALVHLTIVMKVYVFHLSHLSKNATSNCPIYDLKINFFVNIFCSVFLFLFKKKLCLVNNLLDSVIRILISSQVWKKVNLILNCLWKTAHKILTFVMLNRMPMIWNFEINYKYIIWYALVTKTIYVIKRQKNNVAQLELIIIIIITVLNIAYK